MGKYSIISPTDVTSAGFSGTDFEFWMTERDGDRKYHIMAFYNKEHIEEGKAYLKNGMIIYSHKVPAHMGSDPL